MDFGSYALEVIGVSATGVLAPGPLFISNLMLALKNSRSDGFRVAAGHALVEIPLVTVLFFGVLSLQQAESSTRAIALLGAIAIFGFAAYQLLSFLKERSSSESTVSEQRTGLGKVQAKHRVLRMTQSQNPIVVGALVTGLNPFFLLWWLTIGLKLIIDSKDIAGAQGLPLLMSLHTWMDFAWLGITGLFVSRAGCLLKTKTRIKSIIVLTTSALMCAYGMSFILSSVIQR